ncbi:peptide chain release factor N(5)-glutamine methyltransferase [Mycoplasma phocoenae]|uniref:peptide chain release factor N(5)-glutamine methyltransferase n=2 Tax=Mycoplasma phocoenae TaxID=754517 RepID=A0A858U7Q2_9MOLU|nr:peptide chain release factor N(5)-glutamine methyltransferase [Mycoplasma phocoenae]
MPTKDDLIREKWRYNLDLKITNEELELLEDDMPVQKIIGYVYFNKTKINVNKNVLIPRYETEELLNIFHSNESISTKSTAKVLDMCAGSGCIGLSLKNNFPLLDITLADIDSEAIEQIKLNAKELEMNVNIIQSDLFSNINEKYDYIISNPPYIPYTEQLSDSVLKHEPHQALFAKDNGYYFYDIIIKNMNNYLTKNGKLYLEISDHIFPLMKEKTIGYNIEFIKDINGKYRFAILRNNS